VALVSTGSTAQDKMRMAVAGRLTLFVARTPHMFLKKPRPAPILLWSAIITKVLATLFVVYPFGIIQPIHWRAVGVIGAYCIVRLFMGDLAKLAILMHLEMSSPRHTGFLRFLKQCVHSYCAVEKNPVESRTFQRGPRHATSRGNHLCYPRLVGNQRALQHRALHAVP